MQPIAIFLIAWAVFCLLAAWRPRGPRLLMAPMILLTPGALAPAYLVFAYPAFGIAAGQIVGSTLLMGTLALAVRRRSGPLLALVAILLTVSVLGSSHKVLDQATRYPYVAFASAARCVAVVLVAYIVLRRHDVLRVQLPGSGLDSSSQDRKAKRSEPG